MISALTKTTPTPVAASPTAAMLNTALLAAASSTANMHSPPVAAGTPRPFSSFTSPLKLLHTSFSNVPDIDATLRRRKTKPDFAPSSCEAKQTLLICNCLANCPKMVHPAGRARLPAAAATFFCKWQKEVTALFNFRRPRNQSDCRCPPTFAYSNFLRRAIGRASNQKLNTKLP